MLSTWAVRCCGSADGLPAAAGAVADGAAVVGVPAAGAPVFEADGGAARVAVDAPVFDIEGAGVPAVEAADPDAGATGVVLVTDFSPGARKRPTSLS
jgi:hypothetical protein